MLQADATAEKAASQCPSWSNIKWATKSQMKHMLVQRMHVGLNFIKYFVERYPVSRYRSSPLSSFSFQNREDGNNCKIQGRRKSFLLRMHDLSFLHVSTHRRQRLFLPQSFCRIQQNFLQISSMLQHNFITTH